MKVKTSEGKYFFVHQMELQILDTNSLGSRLYMVKMYAAHKNATYRYMRVQVCL